MKKRILYFWAAGLIAWSGITSSVSADENTSTGTFGQTDGATWSDVSNGSDDGTFDFNNETVLSIQVDGEGADAVDTYRVDFEWSNLNFVYVPAAKVWNVHILRWVTETNGDAAGYWYNNAENDYSSNGELDTSKLTQDAPEITIGVENRSSKPINVSFEAGSENRALSFDSDATEETESGITLTVTGEQTIDAPSGVTEPVEVMDSNYGNPYTEDEATGIRTEYSIKVNGVPKPESGDTISIPLTAKISPVTDENNP